MEKSGCIQLSRYQLDLINRDDYSGVLSLMDRWDIATFGELKALIDSGQYQIVETN